MADLKVRHLVVGAVATNCYIAENKKTKEALIIDPGDNAARGSYRSSKRMALFRWLCF